MNKITKDLVSKWIPKRDSQGYKGNYGKVLCIGGNEKMGGAIIMAGTAALYSGAGLVTVATAADNKNALHSHAPEIMCVDMYDTLNLEKLVPSMDTVLIGPGLGTNEDSKAVFKTVIDSVSEEQTLLIDGDGITIYKELSFPTIQGNVIFTPHPGEWKRLSELSPDEENKERNIEKRNELKATVVLKKDRTEVYSGNGVWKNTAGNPAMATGGMGDTLAGMIVGFVGQYEVFDQGVLSAVYLHSYIGDQLAESNYVVLPTTITQQVPKTMRELAN